ncbi:hypothetical protein Tco_0566835 [Tanacetum coccineum]
MIESDSDKVMSYISSPPLDLALLAASSSATSSSEVLSLHILAPLLPRFLLQSLSSFQDWMCVESVPLHPCDPLEKEAGVSLVLRIDSTLPLVDKADSEATEVSCTLNISRAMWDRTGKVDSFAFQNPNTS